MRSHHPKPLPRNLPMPDSAVSPQRRVVISYQSHQGQYFTERLDGTPLDMLLIPSGSFMMGQTNAEREEIIRLNEEKQYQEFFTDELPRHLVTVPSFFLGKYPITQVQWRVVANYPAIEQELNADPSNFKGDNHPVEQVSWDDATEFCRRLSHYTGRTYCLPSEAEWEYACRASPIAAETTSTGDEVNDVCISPPFHFGETISDELANYCAEDREIDGISYKGSYGRGPIGQYRKETTEVGQFSANQFGLHDMYGNVWEWCEDDWHSNYEGAPNDGSAWVDADRKSIGRLLRGGSWDHVPVDCRSACRNVNSHDNRKNCIGFRVCCVSPRIFS